MSQDETLLGVVVEHEGVRHSLEVDLEEDVSFLRFQLHSLTDIDPDEMLIVAPGVTVTPSTPASKPVRDLRLKKGVVLLVRRKQAQAERRDEEQQLAALSLLHQTCSRCVLGAQEAASQPGFTMSKAILCLGCAQACKSMELARGALQPRLDAAPFSCECASQGTCLYFESGGGGAAGELALAAGSAALGEARRRLVAQLEQQRAHHMQAATPNMMRRLKMYAVDVMEYEDAALQQYARGIIPCAELADRALQREAEAAGGAQDDDDDGDGAGVERLGRDDYLLMELLAWFKKDFFKWVNNPPCDACGSKSTRGTGRAQPTPEEAHYRAGVVELYQCANCGTTTRFPRYNRSRILMQTRRGRCGEWAQAFMLCLRAMGFEARLAHDWTDHIWCECFSVARDRWVHCDPCENAHETPLMYESGWKKKLTYVIAFSRDEVLDVTRRYTRQFEEVLGRRVECPEDWLQTQLQALDFAKRSTVTSSERLVELQRRRDIELAFFADPTAHRAAPKPLELHGRQTGSVAWRQARGEIGDVAAEEAVAAPARPAEPAAPAGPAEPAAAPAADAQESPQARTKRVFQRLFKQMSEGCGRAGCTNVYCRSSGDKFVFADRRDNMGKSETATTCIKLLGSTTEPDTLLCQDE